jgi:hypothetical protein
MLYLCNFATKTERQEERQRLIKEIKRKNNLGSLLKKKNQYPLVYLSVLVP